MESGVDFHLDHLRDLLCNLDLLALETVDIVPEVILGLADFGSEVDFLLVSSKFFLLDPAIDGSQLSLD